MDPTKAECIKDAVARHIRDVYTDSPTTASPASADVPTCDSAATVPAPGQGLLVATIVASVLAVVGIML